MQASVRLPARPPRAGFARRPCVGAHAGRSTREPSQGWMIRALAFTSPLAGQPPLPSSLATRTCRITLSSPIAHAHPTIDSWTLRPPRPESIDICGTRQFADSSPDN